ncbi:magnesium/cobalt transporter CorA [Nibribacter ruber]|uniref:Magnesium transport protein CorA n=1 Tax=Nibribacter ruber TaxID=2698458 RepID=A0A6P1P492_9BACT|nr:magnesium/cobalt transporter CorA [Nibribacter ruber]QHL89175.1 magnesium/cobalt transporter CorA [Nibribacter ruber]
MIRCFYLKGGELTWEKNPESFQQEEEKGRIIWVDLQAPSDHEQRRVEEAFGIELFTQQEAAEIESSSRYFEDEGGFFEANTAFVMHQEGSYITRQVSFILQRNILFTMRRTELKSFGETVRKMKTFKGTTIRAIQVWLLLLETQIDNDADFIEHLTRTTNVISKRLVKEQSIEEEVLIRITELQENTILIRESIVDKQRLVSSLLRSFSIDEPEKERLRIVIKDINSLLQHTQFSFERLEYLQNTFLGLVNIEQNKVIKIFTVVTVVFMPPTLIASIYGMNFKFMPELDWVGGYPFALVLMVLASMGFLWYFRRKKWL